VVDNSYGFLCCSGYPINSTNGNNMKFLINFAFNQVKKNKGLLIKMTYSLLKVIVERTDNKLDDKFLKAFRDAFEVEDYA